MSVRLQFVCDFLLILFRIPLWSSAAKELSSCCSYFMPSKLYVFLFHLVSSTGCGIRLYRFLIVAFSSTSHTDLVTCICLKCILDSFPEFGHRFTGKAATVLVDLYVPIIYIVRVVDNTEYVLKKQNS